MKFFESTLFLLITGLINPVFLAQSTITLDNHFEDWAGVQTWTSNTGGNINEVAIAHTSEWVYFYVKTTNEVAIDETTLPNSIQLVIDSALYKIVLHGSSALGSTTIASSVIPLQSSPEKEIVTPSLELRYVVWNLTTVTLLPVRQLSISRPEKLASSKLEIGTDSLPQISVGLSQVWAKVMGGKSATKNATKVNLYILLNEFVCIFRIFES